MDVQLIKKLEATNAEIALVETEISQATVALQKRLMSLKDQDKQIRDAIKEAMKETDTKKFENDFVRISYIAPTTRTFVDAAKLKEMHPRIYKEVIKTSNVSDSVRITIKD